MWDLVDELNAENAKIKEEEMPELEKKIAELEAEIKKEQIKNRALETYAAADPEKTVTLLLMIRMLLGTR